MKTIAIDFDGVIHKYSKGWQDGSIYDETIDGWVSAINSLFNKGYSVFIFTTRDPEKIVTWFYEEFVGAGEQPFRMVVIPEDTEFWNEAWTVGVTQRKLPAIAYIDDRAIRFRESWVKVFEDLREFENGSN